MELYKIVSYDYKPDLANFKVAKFDGSMEEYKVGSNFTTLNDLLTQISGDAQLYIIYENHTLNYFIDGGHSNLSKNIAGCYIAEATDEEKEKVKKCCADKSKTVFGGISPEYLRDNGKTVLEQFIENCPNCNFAIEIPIHAVEERQLKVIANEIAENILDASLNRRIGINNSENKHILAETWHGIIGGNHQGISQDAVDAKSEFSYHQYCTTYAEISRLSIVDIPKVKIHMDEFHFKIFRGITYNASLKTSPYKKWLFFPKEIVSSFKKIIPIDYIAAMFAFPSNPTPGVMRKKYIPYGAQVKQWNYGDSVEIGKLSTYSQTDIPVRININDLTSHAFITGVTGSGKTTTIKKILQDLNKREKAFLVLEPAKNEYKLNYLRNYFQIGRSENNFKLNPFYFPEGVHIQTHIDYIKSVFVAAFPMYGPMPYILETAIYNIYRNKGWNIVTSNSVREKPEYPTLEDLFYEIDDAIETVGYSNDLQSDVRGALKVRISSLMVGAKGNTLNCSESTDFEKILSKPSVINLESIGDSQEKVFIMGLILTVIYEYYVSKNEETPYLKNVLVIEEAHRLLENVSANNNPEIADMKGKSLETFNNILSEIRAYGQGIIIADQIPSKISPDVIKNTNLKIVHRLFAKEDRELIGNSIGLGKNQIDFLLHLQRGEAIAFNSDMEEAVKVRVNIAEDQNELTNLIQNVTDSSIGSSATDNPVFVNECTKMLRTALLLDFSEDEFLECIDKISSDFKNTELNMNILWSKMIRVIISEIREGVLCVESYTEYQKQVEEISKNPYSELKKYIKKYTESKDTLCDNAELFNMFYSKEEYKDILNNANILNSIETIEPKEIIKLSKCRKKLCVHDKYFDEKQFEKIAECIVYNAFIDNKNLLNKYFGSPKI